jgi:putative nucleotidyltransferase with HDIG domain
MLGNRNGAGCAVLETNDAGASTVAYGAIAEDLAREFGAPVGIFDPDRGTWRAVVGAPETGFPEIDDVLRSMTRSSEMQRGQVMVWHRPGNGGETWLVLPMPRDRAGELVALIGFASSKDRREARDGGLGRANPEAPSGVTWGPKCPEPALRLWGQDVLTRIRKDYGMKMAGVEDRSQRDEESEHVVIGRLIRRLRISDPPERFQALATTVLRTSLQMEAVVWVPKDPRESVIVGGAIEGLDASAYRALPSANGRESTRIFNGITSELSRDLPPMVRRYAAVAAGSLGWLVAVNPIDDRAIETIEIERLQYVGSLIVTQLSNARIYADLKELLFGIIRALTAAIDAKDPYTSGHSERVARMAVRLAEELGMPPPKRSDLYVAGLLHDVGKIGVDDQVLKKDGPLTPEEYRKIQAHVEIGVTILKDLKKLHHLLPGVRHHHESFDGKGYPDQLAGEEIPFEARILAVADSFDAMSSNRPYRKRLSLMQIDQIFRKGRGVQWDPDVVDALFACRADLESIRQKGLGESLIGAVNLTLGRN